VVRPASHYVEVGVPALRTLNVKRGRLDLSELVYFSTASNDGPLAKSKLREGDLVIARTGRPGAAAVVPPSLDGANAIDLIIATPGRRALPAYLEAVMNSPIMTRQVLGAQRGQIQQHFNVGSLKEALVPIPPLPAQRVFEERSAAVVELRVRAENHLLGVETLFSSLQDRAFKGEL